MTAEDPAFTLRPAGAGDLEFLAGLYASTRQEELAAVPWSEEQKAVFLRMQFEAQTRHYDLHYPRAQRSIVMCEGQPVGRFWVDRDSEAILVLDIALLPAWRGRGLGHLLLAGLAAEADSTGRAVTLHVEKLNPARRLYDRLGFVKKGDEGPYDLLERRPVSAAG